MLKCGTLSKKETEQVNKRMRHTVDEETKVGTKRSVTRGTYVRIATIHPKTGQR